jgi:hypothetical protein
MPGTKRTLVSARDDGEASGMTIPSRMIVH